MFGMVDCVIVLLVMFCEISIIRERFVITHWIRTFVWLIALCDTTVYTTEKETMMCICGVEKI